MKRTLTNFSSFLLLTGSVFAQSESFYKEPQLFSKAPDPTKSTFLVERFGPVGMAIELIQPAFTMRIQSIEPGSPAEATGKLKPGQIISSINGEVLKDIDPRIQLGNLITAAEAVDGEVRLQIAEKPGAPTQEVVVKIPVMGSYSPTWPLNCTKSNKIVRGQAEWLAKPENGGGFGGIGMLFLLGTGEDKDLAPVKDWVHSLADQTPSRYSWHLGLGGVPLCEYYLRTGDAAALPIIQKWVDTAVAAEYFGGWSQKGIAGNVNYGGGGGHLNAGGTAVVTFLMLAKECGANIPDETFNRVLKHFYRWAGRGNNSYGDGKPEYGMVDNGKNGNLAFAMAAAAALTPDGEKSIYAGARDAAASTSFYTTTFMLHGHSGGGIGEIWRSASMGLLHDKKPKQYRNFMDERKWHYELSRRFDGSMAITAGGGNYDNPAWGSAYALTYIVPRKTLRITGAPPTKFSKPYKLPERPWGTAADDSFASIQPAAYADGKRPDFSDETLAKDSGLAMLARFNAAEIDDETLRRYAHHPDSFIRLMAARRVMGAGSEYLGKATGTGEIRKELAMELFRSPDARVRRAILDAMEYRLAGDEFMAFFGTEGFDQIITMIRDPEESLWVKDAAMNLLGRAPADAVLPHVDLLLGYLKHEEWWLQNAALEALSPVAADERCYEKVIPAIGHLSQTSGHWNTTAPLRWGRLRSNLLSASPKVQKFAADIFGDSLVGYTGKKSTPNGLDITNVYDAHKDFLATALSEVEGGYDLLYEIGKRQEPGNSLPFSKIFLAADPEKFGPELKKAYEPALRSHVIPAYIGNNRTALMWEASNGANSPWNPTMRLFMPGLVKLYNQMGENDYNWRDFGPKWTEMDWHYHTFDPPEKLALDAVRFRYRQVTYPAGMENWFDPAFDPVKAGWKAGRQPFGQYEGKLVNDGKLRVLGGKSCGSDFCRHDAPMQSLWEKEVLLVRGKFKFPKFKEGHSYRLLNGGMSHIGSGDGFRIYINGKLLMERTTGVPARQGGSPVGALLITKEWWPEFEGEVTIAATSFLSYGSTSKPPTNPIPQRHFSLWVQEMKLPPLGEKEILTSATVVPMVSAEWQALQDPEKNIEDPEEGKFRWNGAVESNPKLLGSWVQIGQVAGIDDFKPGVAPRKLANNVPYQQITFSEDGKTSEPLHIWSGNTIMNLVINQAQRMEVKNIDGADHLFIESGNFSTRNPVGWKSPWYVFKRNSN